MLQNGENPDLGAEPFQRERLAPLAREELDDYQAAERPILRQPQARHPAGLELSLECIGIAQRALERVALRQDRSSMNGRGRSRGPPSWTRTGPSWLQDLRARSRE